MERTSFIVPHGHVQARAYICIPVEESMATRSSVMATLMDCDGVVELPEGVEVSDLLTWAEMRPDEASKLSPEQISHALKVGDQMGDKCSSQFASAMAGKILDATWTDRSERDLIPPFILSLNSNLKGLVFQQLPAIYRIIKVVLELWPRAMQHAYFDSLVETGIADIPALGSSSLLEDILSFLSHTSTPARGLKSLCISEEVPPAATAVVSQAVMHHSTSIESLELIRMEPQATLHILPTISQLSHLSHLKLCLRHYPSPNSTTSDAIEGLASSISTLTSLACFQFIIDYLPATGLTTPPPRKLSKLASAGSALPGTSLDPVIQALSTAPCLTSLSFLMRNYRQDVGSFLCRGIEGPFLTLKQLHVLLHSPGHGPNRVPASQLIPPVSPLPALNHVGFDCAMLVSADVGLVHSLLQQTALVSASLECYNLDDAAATLLQERLHTQTRLSHFELRFAETMSDAPGCIHNTIKGIAQVTALTYLDLAVPCISQPSEPQWSTAAVRERLLRPLARCTGLKDLRCRFYAWSSIAMQDGSASASLVSHALPMMTQLTRLDLAWKDRESRDMEADEVFLEGMPALPELRHLHVASLFFDSENAAQTWFESVDLRNLTYLELSISPFNEGALQGLAQRLHSGHKLQRVVVCAAADSAREGWTRGIAGLPRRGLYEFRCGYGAMEERLDDAARVLEGQGFVVEKVETSVLRFKFPAGGASVADPAAQLEARE